MKRRIYEQTAGNSSSLHLLQAHLEFPDFLDHQVKHLRWSSGSTFNLNRSCWINDLRPVYPSGQLGFRGEAGAPGFKGESHGAHK